MDKALVNPIEDQRKEALRHYDEAARLANYWSSFVRNAILAYNPTTMDKQDKTAEERESIINFILGAGEYDGIWFGEDHPYRAGKFWWRALLREHVAELEAKIKALEERLEAADEVLSCVPLPNDRTFRNTYISGFNEALEKYQSLKQ